MRQALCLLLAAPMFVSCSTIERRVYFSPVVDVANSQGPQKPACGWKSFGGAPDTYIVSLNGGDLVVTANESIQPYFWGPWFASVIPVFPVTWAVQMFGSPDLKVNVMVSDGSYVRMDKSLYTIKLITDGFSGYVKPSQYEVAAGMMSLEFPVPLSQLEHFTLRLTGVGEPLDIPFQKASRWSWTQWTPNC